MSKAQSHRQLTIELRHLAVLHKQRIKAFGHLDAYAAHLMNLITRRELRLAVGAK